MLVSRCLTIVIATVLFTIPSIAAANAAQPGVIRGFSAALEKLLDALEVVAAADADDSLTELPARPLPPIEELQAWQLLLDEHLRRREAHLHGANALARRRHQEFSSQLGVPLQRMDELLRRLSTQSRWARQDIEELTALLQSLISAPPPPLTGTLPYHHPDLTSLAPRLTPLLTPAYRSHSNQAVAADLQGTAQAPLSQAIYQQAIAIAEAAGKQHWDPVDLYEWVKNNIETEWYWGSMKGAEETLRQRSQTAIAENRRHAQRRHPSRPSRIRSRHP